MANQEKKNQPPPQPSKKEVEKTTPTRHRGIDAETPEKRGPAIEPGKDWDTKPPEK
jgi:hypothetical protein